MSATSGRKGWEKWVEISRIYTQKPLIYDHQKAGTDVPHTAKNFMQELRASGIDAVILFPQSGPETEKAWIKAAFEQDLGVIVGGLMTHLQYVRSEGGYLADESIKEMYLNAAKLGVTNFGVPGNKPDYVLKIRNFLEQEVDSPVLYPIGFGSQGGSVSEVAKVLGDSWHAIVGRSIYEKENMRNAVLNLVAQI